MTNANVEAVVLRTDGSMLILKSQAGEFRVFVSSTTPIVRFGPGDHALIVAGASIALSRARPAPDGTLHTARVTVGVNGTRLPM